MPPRRRRQRGVIRYRRPVRRPRPPGAAPAPAPAVAWQPNPHLPYNHPRFATGERSEPQPPGLTKTRDGHNWAHTLCEVLESIAEQPHPNGRNYVSIERCAAAWPVSFWPPPPGHLLLPPVYLNGDQHLGDERVAKNFEYDVYVGEDGDYVNGYGDYDRSRPERFAAAEMFRPLAWERSLIGRMFYEELWIPIIHEPAPPRRGRPARGMENQNRWRWSLIRYRVAQGEDHPETFDWYPATREFALSDKADVIAWLREFSLGCFGPADQLHPLRGKRPRVNPIYTVHAGAEIHTLPAEKFTYATFLGMMYFAYRFIVHKDRDLEPPQFRYRHDRINPPDPVRVRGEQNPDPLAAEYMMPQLRQLADRYVVETHLLQHVHTALRAANFHPNFGLNERRLRERIEADGQVTDLAGCIQERETEYDDFISGYRITALLE